MGSQKSVSGLYDNLSSEELSALYKKEMGREVALDTATKHRAHIIRLLREREEERQNGSAEMMNEIRQLPSPHH